MAKVGFWQNGMRGKFAGASYKRGRHGTTQVAVINLDPKNPRSNKQLLQRAIMATVTKAYGQGKEIFDHSFQGVAAGADCQALFASINLRKLRSAIAQDINSGTEIELCKGLAVPPKARGTVAFPFQISDGTYPPVATLREGYIMHLPLGSSTVVANYMEENFARKDLLTFVFFDQRSASSATGETEFVLDAGSTTLEYQDFYEFVSAKFIFFQVRPKAAAYADAEQMVGKTMDELFELVGSNDQGKKWAVLKDVALTSAEDGYNVNITGITLANDGLTAMGVIRSHVDEDLRSKCVMRLYGGGDVAYRSPLIIPAWKQGTSFIDAQSDLILEGELLGENPNTVEPVVRPSRPNIQGVTPFETSSRITITSDAGASIYYTTDGSTPTAASTLYEQNFLIDQSTVVKAIAIKDDKISEVAEKVFVKDDSGTED